MADIETMDLDLSLIVIDPELQPRERMNQDLVAQYAEGMLAGVEFPPIRVFRIASRDDRLYLTQGFHRYHGAQEAGFEFIAAEVVEGNFAEAKWDAAGSNLEWDTAGAKRTNADKRRAVRMALEAKPEASDNSISRKVGVAQSFVSRLRSESSYLQDKIDVPRTVTRNGTTYPMAVGNIGRPSPANGQPTPAAATSDGFHPGGDSPPASGPSLPADPPPANYVVLSTPAPSPFSLEVLPSEVSTETRPTPRPTFNQTNDMVDWAKWTWNPVTGCEHNCAYCYARDIANRFYPEGFTPTYRPERLEAPRNTRLPGMVAGIENPRERTAWRNVFVCSMADLFGRWVPDEWIDGVFDSCRRSPEWNYLFLTKFPQRYVGLDFPETAWVGTSIDEQKRIPNAEKAFRKIDVPVKWLSVEPMREPLEFSDLSMFDWIVIGGQSRSSQAPEFHPDPYWVVRLIDKAHEAGCKVYCKPNTDPERHWAGIFREYPDAFYQS
jgi:protein gp37